MTRRHSSWSRVGVAIAVVASIALAIGVAQASNMGFKMNRVISPTVFPAPKGQNWVALPYKNPYNNAQDICAALGLTAGTGKVVQVDPNTGQTSSLTCGGANFNLAPRQGLIVTNPTAAGGILVGSHQANPPGSITLFPAVFPAPKGDNYFPVPYHTTATGALALCADLGLSGTTTVLATNAASGQVNSTTCGSGVDFTLVLGESVKIRLGAGNPVLNVAAGHPAHF